MYNKLHTDNEILNKQNKIYIIYRDPVERVLSAYQFPLSGHYHGTNKKSYDIVHTYLSDVINGITELKQEINNNLYNKDNNYIGRSILQKINIHILPQYLFYYNIYKNIIDKNELSNVEIVNLKDLTPFIENVLQFEHCSKNNNHINKTSDNNKLNLFDRNLYTDDQIKEFENLLSQIKDLHKEDYLFYNKMLSLGKVMKF